MSVLRPSVLNRTPAIVVGGGIIGLSIAWRLAQSGAAVTLFSDPSRPGAASWAAGGMLSVAAETAGAPKAFIDLCFESQRRWPEFAAALETASDQSIDLSVDGTLLIARSEDERAHIEAAKGLERLSPGDVSALEPNLSGPIVAAALARGDGRVDNRLVIEALTKACQRAGVSFAGPARRIRLSDGRADGVEGNGGTVSADMIVLASGVWTDQVLEASGLGQFALRVEPVKGQMLAYELPTHLPRLERVVRAPGLYLVPRGGRRLVVGATSENAGLDVGVTSEGIELLREEAERLMPALATLDPVETWAGLRPKTRGGLPVLAQTPVPGLVLVSGHYRNGILLAPLTADLVVGQLAGTLSPQERALLCPFMGIDEGPQVSEVKAGRV